MLSLLCASSMLHSTYPLEHHAQGGIFSKNSAKMYSFVPHLVEHCIQGDVLFETPPGLPSLERVAALVDDNRPRQASKVWQVEPSRDTTVWSRGATQVNRYRALTC